MIMSPTSASRNVRGFIATSDLSFLAKMAPNREKSFEKAERFRKKTAARRPSSGLGRSQILHRRIISGGDRFSGRLASLSRLSSRRFPDSSAVLKKNQKGFRQCHFVHSGSARKFSNPYTPPAIRRRRRFKPPPSRTFWQATTSSASRRPARVKPQPSC